MTTNKHLEVNAYTKYRDYYKQNKILGGLISWDYVVKTDTLEDVVTVLVPKGVKVLIKEVES